MSLIGCWSPALDPLWASPLVTLPHTQLLAAHPHEPAELLLQSSDRYAAMREPSTPALTPATAAQRRPGRGCPENPCKRTRARRLPSRPRSRKAVGSDFACSSSSRPLNKDESLERGRNADGERPVARIRALVDPPELVPDVAGGPDGVPGRQGWIEPRVPGDGEQVFHLHVDSRRRDPPDPGRRQIVADLQVAQPDVRRVLEPIARELPAERCIAHVYSGVLGVRDASYVRLRNLQVGYNLPPAW